MIVLKKEVNEIFEANKLPELTVDIQNGFLQIVGRKCGQPLMMINGISPAKKMTKEEREIVLNDYLIPVITTHKKDFDAVISTKRAGKVLKDDMHTELDKVNKLKNLRVVISSAHNYTTNTSKLTVACYVNFGGKNGIATFSESEISIDTCSYTNFNKIKKLIDGYKPKIKAIIDLVEKVNANDSKAAEAQAKLATVCGW